MADWVWGAAVSHTGAMMRRPSGDAEDGSRANRVFAGFDALSARLRAARPDVLIVVATDHFLTFSYEQLPIFAIGTGVEFKGHGEFGVPKRDYTGLEGWGEQVHGGLVQAGFDISSARDMPLDHSFSCPLQLLMKGWDMPVLPIYVNCTVAPLPSLRRCADFGKALRRVVEALPGSERVAILGTGGLSHWVGTPETGQINTRFDQRFLADFAEGNFDRIADYDHAPMRQPRPSGRGQARQVLNTAPQVPPSGGG
ncbi:MAG: hypothetical protein WCY07_14330, partial [Pigmentiphaga sp.]